MADREIYLSSGEILFKDDSQLVAGRMEYKDGWTPAGTFTYDTATTITVASGAALIYAVGDKIKLTQTTVKYFYIVGVADTVLTITGGITYTLISAVITLPFYSHQASPLLFPQFFAYTPTGPTNTTLTGRFCVNGRNVKCSIKGILTAAPSFANMPTLPITAGASLLNLSDIGICGTGGYTDQGTQNKIDTTFPVVVANDTTCSIRIENSLEFTAILPITWASSDKWWVTFDYEI